MMYIFMFTESKQMPVQIFTEKAFDVNTKRNPEILDFRIFFYATLDQGLT